MTKIQGAFYPLLVIASILGAQMIEYRLAYLGYVQFIMSWCSYLVVIHHLWYAANFNTLFASVIFRMVMLANVSCCVIMTVLALCYKKGCFDELTALNKNLQRLGVSGDYPKLQKSVRHATMFWCFGCIVMLSIDSMWIFKNFSSTSALMILATLNYSALVNSIVFIIMCEILNYIGSRFDKMNKCIKILTNTNDRRAPSRSCDRLFSLMYGDQNLGPVKNLSIWIVMRMHTQLCKTSRLINQIFGVQITIEIGVYFINIVSVFITVYEELFIKQDISYDITRLIACSAWFTMYVIRLIYVNHVFESTCSKANDTGRFIYNYLNSVSDACFHREIGQYILYMLHRPLKFDSFAIQSYGYCFIIKFFAGSLTFGVIILQTKAFYQKFIINDAVHSYGCTSCIE